MPEWSNGTVSKTVVRATVPRVRIPLFPPGVAGALAKATFAFEYFSLTQATFGGRSPQEKTRKKCFFAFWIPNH